MTNQSTTAPEPPKRGRGRPRRGARVELKLPTDVLAQVEALVGIEGADRSEVLATLVTRGLAASEKQTPALQLKFRE